MTNEELTKEEYSDITLGKEMDHGEEYLNFDTSKGNQSNANQIEMMQHEVDYNTKMIKRINTNITVLEGLVEQTYNHPDILSNDREHKRDVRKEQDRISDQLQKLEAGMGKLVKAKDRIFEMVRDTKRDMIRLAEEKYERDKYCCI